MEALSYSAGPQNAIFCYLRVYWLIVVRHETRVTVSVNIFHTHNSLASSAFNFLTAALEHLTVYAAEGEVNGFPSSTLDLCERDFDSHTV